MEKHPEIKFCPFCAGSVYFERSVPRCEKCRAVFFVQFSRYMRAPRKVLKAPSVQRGPARDCE